MKTLSVIIKRNTKLFFKDKAMFFTALITPGILLVLYATFLGNVYLDSFKQGIPEGLSIPAELLDAAVNGQLVSSILAVSCVTVAFCTNMLSVQDKANGTVKDLTVSPVSSATLALGYYISALISTLAVCLTAAALCFGYIAITDSWYLSLTDALLILLDVFILTLFGVALSSIINFFLSTQGQISAVGTIISAGYGFICGAYMPISQFSEGLRNVIAFLPGTYATSLLRNHCLRGAFNEMENIGLPAEFTKNLRDAVDCNLYLFGKEIPLTVMFAVITASSVALVLVYILMHFIKTKRNKK